MPTLLQETGQYQCDFRFQHKHRPLSVIISLSNDQTLHVSLPIPIRSICPGQVKYHEFISFCISLFSFSMPFSTIEMKY